MRALLPPEKGTYRRRLLDPLLEKGTYGRERERPMSWPLRERGQL